MRERPTEEPATRRPAPVLFNGIRPRTPSRLTPLLTLAALLLAMGAVALTTAPGQAANFVLKPTSGAPGFTFVASGDGYANCFADWFVVWDQPLTEFGHTGGGQATIPDARSATVLIPFGSTPGPHTVKAMCDTGDGIFEADSASFRVTAPGGGTTSVPTTTPTTTTTVPRPFPTLSPTTAIPTTTPRVTTTIRPAVVTTAPPVTTTTTVRPAPTTPPAPATTSTTALPPPATVPGGPTSLVALSPEQRPSGPPGVTLDIAGSGYTDCETVYFFFDGVRIGSAPPDPTGAVRDGGYSVPGDADTGAHTVSSSCRASGGPVRQTSTFLVTAAKVHRPALLTSLPQPRDIPLTPGALALSGGIAAAAIILLAFPYQLFNSTLEENYEEVRAWFGFKPKPPDYEPKHQGVLFAVFLLASGVLYAVLSPDFGFNRTTLVISAGLALAVLVTGVGFALPGVLYRQVRHGDRGRLRVLPGTIVVAAVTVLLSRAVGFTPGYVYGLLAVFAFRNALNPRTEGRLAAATSVVVLVLCLAAWFARVPVSSAAGGSNPSVLLLILEAALGGIFLFGLESLLVDLLPLRFLDGSRIKAWSRTAWAVLIFVGAFVLVHVLIAPGSGYVSNSENTKLKVVVAALYVAFGMISLSFWGYFRFRADRPRGPEGSGGPATDRAPAQRQYQVSSTGQVT